MLLGLMVLLSAIAICAVESTQDFTRYERINRRLFPYDDHEISYIRKAPKREIKLRTASGFGKRDDIRNSVGIGKRDESKIKKLQRGSLRTAIGFGKRNFKYRAPESDLAVLQKIRQKEKYVIM